MSGVVRFLPADTQYANGSNQSGAAVWVILPTYQESENLPGIAAAILASLPGATLLGLLMERWAVCVSTIGSCTGHATLF